MKWLKFLLIFIVAFFMLGTNNVAESETVARDFKVAIIYPFSLNQYMSTDRPNDKIPYIRKIAPSANIRTFFMNLEPGLSQAIIDDRAKKLSKRIETYAPDMIIMYYAETVEHFGVPYIYDKGKNNSMFLNVDDHEYLRISNIKHLDDIKYKGLVRGLVDKDDLSQLTAVFNEVNPDFKNIYVITGGIGMHGDEEYVIAEIRKGFVGKNIEIIKANNSKELKTALEVLNKKEFGLLVDLLESPTDYTSNKIISEKEIAGIYKTYNKKHLEITCKYNYSKYGFAASFVHYMSKEMLIDEKMTCNKCIASFYNNEFPAAEITYAPRTLILNKARVDRLDLEKIYNLSYMIKMLILE
jgi:hypothetical protein